MRNSMNSLFVLVGLVVLLLDSAPVSAQCNAWLPGPLDNGTAPNGADSVVEALINWDPDGAGGQSGTLIAGGRFSTIQGVSANHIAARHPVTGQWQPLGSGTNGFVYALAVYNGELIAGGQFNLAGGQTSTNIARWNGFSWSPLANAAAPSSQGCQGIIVNALAVYNGELYAGGDFHTAGGLTGAGHIARWNGNSWSLAKVTTGFEGNFAEVKTLMAYNGELIAGGSFMSVDGQAAIGLARWNGVAWQAFSPGIGGGFPVTTAYDLTIHQGKLIVGGHFESAGGQSAKRVAAWNGSTWSALGSGFDQLVQALTVDSTGALIAGGFFSNSGTSSCPHVARWNGSTWQSLVSPGGVGGVNGNVDALCPWNDEVIVGGSFSTAGGVSASRIARWSGGQWTSFGGGIVDSVNALATVGSRLVAGGVLTQSTNTAQMANYLVAWNGSSLSPLSGGGVNAPIHALKSFSLSSNFLIAGGEFTLAGTQGGIGGTDGVAIPANRIAMWNDGLLNGGWSAMGSGFNAKVLALERVPANQFFGDNIFAGGEFTAAGNGSQTFNRVASWSGSPGQWFTLGTGFNNRVCALKGFNNGPVGRLLYAGGDFTTASGVSANRIAHYPIPNQNGWVAMGSGFNFQVNAIELHSGSIYAGGWFTFSGATPLNRIARWTGTAWVAVGLGGPGGGFNGPVFALKSSGANLYAAGDFTTVDGIAAPRVAKWNGASWSAVQGGADAAVFALSMYQTELVAGGTFDTVSAPAITSAGVARFTETNVPWIISGGQPSLQAVECGDTASFDVQIAPGYTSLTYQWRKNAVPLANGPAGSGSMISGATTATLTIANVHSADAGNYSCVISNACTAGVTSGAAPLSLTNSCCTPDINGNGVVDIDDLLAVINAWGLCPAPPALCLADIAPLGGNGVVDIDDMLAVINGWGPCP